MAMITSPGMSAMSAKPAAPRRCATAPQAHDHGTAANVADRLVCAFAVVADDDLLDPELGVDVDHAAQLRVQREAGHLGTARLIRGDHTISARALELLLRVFQRRARHDRDVRAQPPGRERDEDVVGVGSPRQATIERARSTRRPGSGTASLVASP